VIERKNWATSRKDRKIALYASGNLKLQDHPILLIGGVHGDEPEGVELAEKTLGFLGRESEKIQVPWIVIPCLNVDGFSAKTRTNGAGVDLNRNYASLNWSPIAEKERYFPGPKPGSEPEVQAIMNLIEELDPRIIIHCHSWNPCIVCAGQPGQKDAELLGSASGYEVRPEIGYPTPGSLSQYGWADRKIPVICIEEKDGTPLDQVWPHFEPAMRDIFADSSLRRDNLRAR
jgi:hypothetical protein